MLWPPGGATWGGPLCWGCDPGLGPGAGPGHEPTWLLAGSEGLRLHGLPTQTAAAVRLSGSDSRLHPETGDSKRAVTCSWFLGFCPPVTRKWGCVVLIFYLDFLWVDGAVPDQKRSVWRAAWTLLPHLDADRRGRQRHGGRCLLECFWPHQHTSRGLCARSSVQERSAVALTSFSKLISTVLSGCFLNFLFVIFFSFFFPKGSSRMSKHMWSNWVRGVRPTSQLQGEKSRRPVWL